MIHMIFTYVQIAYVCICTFMYVCIHTCTYKCICISLCTCSLYLKKDCVFVFPSTWYMIGLQ